VWSGQFLSIRKRRKAGEKGHTLYKFLLNAIKGGFVGTSVKKGKHSRDLWVQLFWALP